MWIYDQAVGDESDCVATSSKESQEDDERIKRNDRMIEECDRPLIEEVRSKLGPSSLSDDDIHRALDAHDMDSEAAANWIKKLASLSIKGITSKKACVVCRGASSCGDGKQKGSTSADQLLTKPYVLSCSRLLHDFEVQDSHGYGAFGHVFKCKHKLDKYTYAIKRVRMKPTVKTQMEVAALASLQHQHIVRYHQVWIEQYVNTGQTPRNSFDNNTTTTTVDCACDEVECLFIQMEYCIRSLDDIWKHAVDSDKAWDLLSQIAKGLSYMHGAGILHCDLHPGNILLDSNSNVKIADFGLARFMGKKKLEDTSLEISPEKLDGKALGNRVFRAPELLDNEDISEKVDIYSMGIIAVGLFYLTELERNVQRKAFSKTKKLPACFDHEDQRTKVLLCRLVDSAPSMRPSAEEVVKFLSYRNKDGTIRGDESHVFQ